MMIVNQLIIKMYRTLFLVITIVCLTDAYEKYQANIPNGANVPDPCQTSTIWPGVGHRNMAGRGDRNPFGLDFANNNHVWTLALCRLDSDGDGRTNGQELGDPDCVWNASSGNAPATKTGLSHPGICEPITSPNCRMLNGWLSCTTFSCPAWKLNTTMNVSLTLARTAVPVQETTYMCQAFKLPNSSNFHIIGIKPELDNTNVVHHMLLYGCPSAPDASMSFTTPQSCQMYVPGCESLLALWTVGVAGDCFSDQYGIPLGNSGIQYAVLQVHWNNAKLVSNQFDSSGLMLYYTSHLRPNDGQIVMMGQTYLNIPPAQASVSVAGGCVSECTQFMPHSVNITSAILHMHLLGVSGDIKLTNNSNNDSRTILTEPAYDYNSPTQVRYDPPISFSPGDEILVDCVFKSVGKNKTTVFGPSTSDEMCFGFLTIYPAIPLFDNCFQFGELTIGMPICPLLSYPHCNINNFFSLLDLIGWQCDENCTKSCRNLIALIYDTGCFDGTLGLWMNQVLQPNYAKGKQSFEIILNTCAQEHSGIKSTTAHPSVTNGANFPRLMLASVGLLILFIGSNLRQ